MGNRFLMIRSRNQGRSIATIPYPKLTHEEFVRELDRLLTNAGIDAEGPLNIQQNAALTVVVHVHRGPTHDPRT